MNHGRHNPQIDKLINNYSENSYRYQNKIFEYVYKFKKKTN